MCSSLSSLSRVMRVKRGTWGCGVGGSAKVFLLGLTAGDGDGPDGRLGIQ